MDKNKKNIPGAGVKIIGFGNIFMSDDGLGVRVIERLRDKKIAAEVIDGGTSAADLIIHAKNSEKIIIIDAVDAGQKTGEIIRFRADEINRFEHSIRSFSLHDFNLSQALEMIEKLGIDVDIVVIGIKPKNIGFGQNLTPEIEKKIPSIIDMAIKEANI
ncbi:MAG: hydrogenase maturation protease [Actinomycetota bacterium]